MHRKDASEDGIFCLISRTVGPVDACINRSTSRQDIAVEGSLFFTSKTG